MLAIVEGSSVYLALQPNDLRRGIAALSVYGRKHPGMEPASGIVCFARVGRIE